MKRWLPFLLPFAFYLLASHARAENYTMAVLNEASLQSFCKLWEAAGASSIVDAKAGNTATPTAVTFGPSGLLKDGEADSSASFNGRTSVVSVGNGSVFNWEYTQAWTIECICNPNVTRSGGTVNYPIFAKDAGGPNYTGYGVYLQWTGTKAVLLASMISNFGANHWCQVESTTDIPNGRPVHLAVTYSGSGTASGFTLYVNGVAQPNQVQSDTLGGNSILNSAGPNLGYDNTTHFAGSLEAVAVYNAALSASTVNTHYLWTGFAGFWFAGLCPTVVQSGGNVTVTFTPSVGTFDGSTTITATMTDASGNALGTFTNSPLTPTSGSASGTMNWTAPVTEQVGILSFTNNKTNWKSEFTYTAGVQGGPLTANGTGQWALYVQKAAVPTRLETIDSSGGQTHSGYTGVPGNDPAFSCPTIRDAWNGFVYAGSSINCFVDNTPNLTRFELRDRKGNVVRSGPASGNLVTISTTGLANGAYELGLFSSTSNSTWGDRHESSWIGIVPHTSHVYDTQPLCWAAVQNAGWVEFGGSAVKTASEAPGNNSSGAWPYYVKRTGTIAPTVSGNLYLRQSTVGSRRLTCNGTVFDDVFGATWNTGTWSNGVSISVSSGTAYAITLEAAPGAQGRQSDTLQYSTDNSTWKAVPISWFNDGQGNSGVLLANYYGQQFLTLETYLHTHERISVVANAHPLDELNALTGAIGFIINNLVNRDSQRPILPFVAFPGYRTFSQTTSGALTGGTSTSLTLSNNPAVGLVNGGGNTYQVIAGVRLRFPSTGETAVVANTWSSSTPNTIPLTAAVRNSYASGVQVIIDPSFEDAAITSAANWLTQHFPGQSFGLEPTNEPTETDPTTIQKPFYQAVQAASVPTQFKVMGPCAVTQHSSNYLSGTLGPGGWQKSFGDNGGYAWVQQFSGHLYHHDCGDQSVLRSQLADLAAHRTAYNITSQFIDTELGYRNTLTGLMAPMRQAAWLGQTLILAEQLGVPYQNLPYWNLYSHGDPIWNTGVMVQQSDQLMESFGPLPAALLLRNFKEQLFGTSAASTTALNFANAGDMVFGNLYHRASAGGTNSAGGTDTICLMSPNRDMSVTFTVTGGDGTLHTVDAYGNTNTVTVTAGHATVTGIGEPFFIQLENGQTATPLTGANWGANFAAATEGTTVTVTGGSSTNVAAIISGNLANYYSGTTPYTDLAVNNTAAASSFPITFTFDMGQTRRISQVEVYEPAPFQSVGGTILDWSWDYWNGNSWQTLVSRQKRYPNQLAAFCSYAQGLVVDFSDHKYMILDSFAPLSFQKFRLNVYAASNGGATSQLAQEGGTDGAAFYPFVAISAVRARLVGGGLAAAAGNVINLAGANTGWVAGSPGSPAFSVQKFPTNDMAVTSQSVTDSTHATINLNAGSTDGYVVITDPTTGVKSAVRVGPNGQLNPGNALNVRHDLNN